MIHLLLFLDGLKIMVLNETKGKNVPSTVPKEEAGRGNQAGMAVLPTIFAALDAIPHFSGNWIPHPPTLNMNTDLDIIWTG